MLVPSPDPRSQRTSKAPAMSITAAQATGTRRRFGAARAGGPDSCGTGFGASLAGACAGGGSAWSIGGGDAVSGSAVRRFRRFAGVFATGIGFGLQSSTASLGIGFAALSSGGARALRLPGRQVVPALLFSQRGSANAARPRRATIRPSVLLGMFAALPAHGTAVDVPGSLATHSASDRLVARVRPAPCGMRGAVVRDVVPICLVCALIARRSRTRASRSCGCACGVARAAVPLLLRMPAGNSLHTAIVHDFHKAGFEPATPRSCGVRMYSRSGENDGTSRDAPARLQLPGSELWYSDRARKRHRLRLARSGPACRKRASPGTKNANSVLGAGRGGSSSGMTSIATERLFRARSAPATSRATAAPCRRASGSALKNVRRE